METQSSYMNLPIMKNFSEGEISNRVDKFRKGEKGLFWFIKLGALIGLGYLTWVYILPPVFIALGQFAAIAATGIALVGLVMAIPVILKGLRLLTRNLHKAIIKHDPFAELENQRKLMIANQEKFRLAKGKIANLRQDMEVEADKSEKDAKEMQTRIVSLQTKAQKLKAQLDEMVNKNGVAAKGSDEYVNGEAELMKLLSEAQRVGHQMEQSKDFVVKYGTRANIMKKFGQKLVKVETSMDIKVSDFNATIEILKKDYAFAQKSRGATESAKSAMLFTKSWELDYALDVVTSTIAEDIAVTAGNLNDIDTLTSKYSLDSDELYANLDALAGQIKTNENSVPSAKSYNNPEYKLTSDDKLKSGGFGELFN
jgi:hypothetical protein